ncbi:MAG: hypothetical protein HYS40_08560 [Gemmatimonadetes bacterium]|nr:hypothetical protein [Gemmatimonadota bacterium]
MLRNSLARLGLSSLLIVAACSDSAGPKLPPCTLGRATSVTLAVGAYLSVDPASDSGCVAVSGNASVTDSAEYLLVPQSAAGEPGLTTSFRLAGDTIVPLAVSASLQGYQTELPLPLQFHDFLRRAERARWYGAPPVGQPEPEPRELPAAALVAGPPPVVGSTRQFSVCATLTCTRFTRITATARSVGTHLGIYVDNAAPANGLTTADLDSLKNLFDTRLYGIDTAAFGSASDVDGNSVVIVLMTPVVNKLVAKADCAKSGFVAGFFFGADIDPAFANDNRFNHGEVFYSIVADPDSTLSCAHSQTEVKRLVPVTFVHEFQHMISFNEHVLVRNGEAEVLWLNEALSHFAEELGGRSFLPGDNASFTRFVIGNLFNAYQYLDSSAFHFLVPTEGIGSLPERGAAWLFMRYLVDQNATDTSTAAVSAFTRTLVQTSLTGEANVAAQTGDPFELTVTRWALANWVSDLPAFAAPSELQYTSWRFRTTYASLNAQQPSFFPKPYPLTPTMSAGNAVDLAGTLRSGSGVYHRVFQAPSAPGFTLLFSTSRGGPLPANVVPRLNIIRIR